MLAGEATGQTNVLNLLLLSASTLIALNITRLGMEDYTMFVSVQDRPRTHFMTPGHLTQGG